MSTQLGSIWVIVLLTVYIVIITSSNLELVSFQFNFQFQSILLSCRVEKVLYESVVTLKIDHFLPA